MTPQTDRDDLGKKLFALLREHGLPEGTVGFSVHVRVNEIIRVDCEFYPAPTHNEDQC